MTPEGKVKKEVKKILDEFGVYYEMPVPSGFGKSGLDFECVFRGYALSIETKAKGAKPTPRQELTIRAKRRAGAVVVVISGEEDVVLLRRVLSIMNSWDQHALVGTTSDDYN